MKKLHRLQGRVIRPKDLAWLRELIATHPEWSRGRIATEVCAAWKWRDEKGRAKDFAARTLLLKLEARGEVTLPPVREQFRSGPWRWQPKPEASVDMPASFQGTLPMVQPLSVEVVRPGTEPYRRWSGYLAQHHYLGLRVVGENLGYLVRSVAGQDLACLLFGAAAWKCAPRDAYIEWNFKERAERLREVANNTRFLILPWVRVPCLASHVLAAVARRIDRDWQGKYGHGLKWLETFVERDRFRGTCYRAANWSLLGQTQGRSRQDRGRTLQVPVKDVYLYNLSR